MFPPPHWPCGSDLWWQTVSLCGEGVGVGLQKEHLSKGGHAAHCVLPLGKFGINPAVKFPSPRRPSHPSLWISLICQIHSVNTGLIKMLRSKGTGSLWGLRVLFNDRVVVVATSGDVQYNQIITWNDGRRVLTSASLSLFMLLDNALCLFITQDDAN